MISVSYPIRGGNLAEVGAASRLLKEQLKRIGVQADVMRRVMIAAYEAEANVTIHARRGTLFARLGDGRIDMEIVDEGPGIPDVTLAMSEGWSTAPKEARKLGFGAGMGLPNIKRSSDRFSIETRVGKGTRVHSTITFGAAAAASATAEAVARCAPLVRGERCVACLDCVRACPTEAIRLAGNRPVVLRHLCIGCAACVASCRHAVFEVVEGVGPEPLPQGSALVTPAGLLAGLGRDPLDVVATLARSGMRELRSLEDWEAALLDEACRTAAWRPELRPVLPPICPAAVNLVQASYPSLIPHLLPCLSPIEAASAELDTEPVVAVVGCPAQAAALEGDGAAGRVLARTPADVASFVAAQPRAGRPTQRLGIGVPGGERDGVARAEGARRVCAALAAAERGLLTDVAVLDLRLCEGGCSGSPLHATDPAVARLRLVAAADGSTAAPRSPGVTPRASPYERRRGVRLDDDMAAAMRKLGKIDELCRTLPGRDCAVCGSPSCASLAEDVVLGRCATDCPFVAAGGAR